ncbi:PaaI family thioesterase [Streptomyces gilvus]|uniref:PaaI family thioesterase n=1 Tax=Streptomyces gilvus TaxID=2920937 RepID=UPI001F10B6E6|nr:PaaI family thioesterase [Streptomyces sp. CME 23]MCH5675623.1 PaaI family thioesterase [Streptomyces sp. CME 23]
MNTDESKWAGANFQEPPRSDGGVALCGACRVQGVCRVGLTTEKLHDGVAHFKLECPRTHEGGPNVAHGGWTSYVMDEVMGHLPLLNKQMTVTAEISVSFVKPVPVERPLEARSWITRREGSRWYLSGELVLESSGSVLAKASGIWVARDPDRHFRRHQAWLTEQEGQ